MTIDIRAAAARYYDMNSDVPKDLEFYHDRIQSPDSTVLELGCGTGRVLVPLVEDCAHIHGIDVSSAMLSICQDKLRESRIPIERAHLEIGDITEINLGKTFDLITAPFRVFQNLETDVEIDRFFETVRNHLSPGATCILNVFKPKREAVDLCQDWVKKGEYPCWETRVEGERVNCHGRNARIDQEKMVLYPELIYRSYRGNDLVEEVILKIVMRCYYPEEFEKLILQHGFDILNRWGGYSGELYGEGPELVIEFGNSS